MGKQKQERKSDPHIDNGIKRNAKRINRLTEKIDKLSSTGKRYQKIRKRLETENESLRGNQKRLAAGMEKLACKSDRLKEQVKALHQENGLIQEKLTVQIDDSYVSRSRLNSCENEIRANRQVLKQISDRLDQLSGLRSDYENLDERLQQRISSVEQTLGLTDTPRFGFAQAPGMPEQKPDEVSSDTDPVERIMGRRGETHADSPAAAGEQEEESRRERRGTDTRIQAPETRLDNDISRLTEEQERQEQRTDHLDRLLDELRREIDVLREVIDNLDVRLDDATGQTEHLIPQISELTADLKTLAEETERQLSTRSEELQSAISELDRELASLKGEFVEELAEVKQSLSSQRSMLSSVREEAKRNQAKVEEVESRLETGLSDQAVQLNALGEQTVRQQIRHNRLTGAFWAFGVAILILAGGLYWQNQATLKVLGNQQSAELQAEPAPPVQESPGNTDAEESANIDLAAWDRLQSDMADRQTAIEDQGASIEKHEGLIADLSALIREQRALIGRQSDRLDEQEEMLKTQASRLADHDELLSSLSSASETQSARLEETGQTLDEHTAQLTKLAEQQSLLSGTVERLERAAPATGTGSAMRTKRATAVALNGPGWLAELPARHYTIQLVGAFQEQVIHEVAGMAGVELPLAHYQKRLDGKPWNVLLYGDFSTVESAREALDRLPEALQEAGPWIRSMSGVQRELEPAH